MKNKIDYFKAKRGFNYITGFYEKNWSKSNKVINVDIEIIKQK